MNAQESRRAESATLPLASALMAGKRVEVTGKAGLIVYMGRSSENRRDCFWYESRHGRTYKDDPFEIIRTVLPHVGIAALERAMILDK